MKINPSGWLAINSIYLICFLLSVDIPLTHSWQNSRNLLQEQPPALLHELTWQQVLSRRGHNHFPLIFPINPLILHYSAVQVIYLFMLLLAKQGKLNAEKKKNSLLIKLWGNLPQAKRDAKSLLPVSEIYSGDPLTFSIKKSLPEFCTLLSGEGIEEVHWNARVLLKAISLMVYQLHGMDWELYSVLQAYGIV